VITHVTVRLCTQGLVVSYRICACVLFVYNRLDVGCSVSTFVQGIGWHIRKDGERPQSLSCHTGLCISSQVIRLIIIIIIIIVIILIRCEPLGAKELLTDMSAAEGSEDIITVDEWRLLEQRWQKSNKKIREMTTQSNQPHHSKQITRNVYENDSVVCINDVNYQLTTK